MLTETQEEQLTAILQGICTDLQLEEAQVDNDHNLEVVICREFICFRPIQISAQEVDILAALDGQPQAQADLQMLLRAALPNI